MGSVSLKRKIFYFWGLMDALAFAFYFISSLQQGKIPFVTDALSFCSLIGSVAGQDIYSRVVALFFILEMILLLSLFISAWLFYKKNRYAVRFSFAQEFLRLISFRGSISFLPLFTTFFGVTGIWTHFFLFVLSEVIKLGSLVYIMKTDE